MVRALLFDLDNTLYSKTTGMERDIIERMTWYVARYLGVDFHEALRLRHERVRSYGTTLEWLQAEHGPVDTEDYFAAVHPPGEERCLEPDPELELFLDSIALPKAVFTNSTSEHARRVLERLGVADCFSGVYDIRFNRLVGKPHPDSYARVLADFGYRAEETFLVDDMRHCVRGFYDCGGYAALLDELNEWPDYPLPRICSLADITGLLGDPRSLEAYRKPL